MFQHHGNIFIINSGSSNSSRIKKQKREELNRQKLNRQKIIDSINSKTYHSNELTDKYIKNDMIKHYLNQCKIQLVIKKQRQLEKEKQKEKNCFFCCF